VVVDWRCECDGGAVSTESIRPTARSLRSTRVRWATQRYPEGKVCRADGKVKTMLCKIEQKKNTVGRLKEREEEERRHEGSCGVSKYNRFLSSR
jgi:hypothetical protein